MVQQWRMAEDFVWSRESVVEKMKDICREEGCLLTFYSENDGLGGFNYAASSGEEIMLAPFNVSRDGLNPLECQFISFFHELAHIRLADQVPSQNPGYAWNGTSKFQYEMWITMLGVEHAHSKYGIKFSDDAVKWLIDENKTYDHHGEDGGLDLFLSRSDGNEGYVLTSQGEHFLS